MLRLVVGVWEEIFRSVDYIDYQVKLVRTSEKWLVIQIGNLPQIGVKIKNIWNHHLEKGLLRKFMSQQSPGPICSHLVPQKSATIGPAYFHVQTPVQNHINFLAHWTITHSNQTFDYEACPSACSRTAQQIAPWWGHFSLEDLLPIWGESCS